MKFARFVVRPNMKGVTLAFNYQLFPEGVIFEIADPTGSGDPADYIIRELGPSPLGLDDDTCQRQHGCYTRERYGFTNANDHNQLLTCHGGRALRTMAEIDADYGCEPGARFH